MNHTAHEADTRQRVLECATRLFAERGFRQTTISDICQAAGANIAAVNYYFGSKENLYQEAWRHAYSLTREAREGLLDRAGEMSPEEVIRRFIRTRLDDITRGGPENYFWQILDREHHEPTPAHRAIIREVFRPLADRLVAVVARLLGPRASETLARLSFFALVGSLAFVALHRDIVGQVFGRDALSETDSDAVYDHVMRFFFAGLSASREALERGEAHPALTAPGDTATNDEATCND